MPFLNVGKRKRGNPILGSYNKLAAQNLLHVSSNLDFLIQRFYSDTTQKVNLPPSSTVREM